MILLSETRYDGVENITSIPSPALSMMSADDQNDFRDPSSPPSISKDWGSGFGSGRTKLFNNPDDFDIYCDREKNMNYIFHGPELNCTIDHLEYDPDTQRITVFTNDSQQLDLGAKIQWLVRPYIAKEQYLYIIRTKDGQAIDGLEVHLRIKEPKITKTLN